MENDIKRLQQSIRDEEAEDEWVLIDHEKADKGWGNGDIFVCALTKKPIVDPAYTVTGHMFEESAIRKWVTENGTCPMTGK